MTSARRAWRPHFPGPGGSEAAEAVRAACRDAVVGEIDELLGTIEEALAGRCTAGNGQAGHHRGTGGTYPRGASSTQAATPDRRSVQEDAEVGRGRLSTNRRTVASDASDSGIGHHRLKNR